jgi:hypothetical protein
MQEWKGPEGLRRQAGEPTAAIVIGVTAAATRPPFADASPAEIRAALIPEERTRFDREYRQALRVAAETFSLDELDKTLQFWRRIAWMCIDPDRYRRMWRHAAELYARENIPAEEALLVTKARLGY